MKKITGALLGVGAVLLLSSSAMAQARPPLPGVAALPAQCRTGTGPTLFRAGRGIGQDVGEQIWEQLDEDCFNVDELLELAADQQASADSTCLGRGFAAGLQSFVDDTADQCVSECVDAGADLGRSLADTFCDAPAFFRIQVEPLCTVIIEGSCEATFDAAVRSQCPAKAQNRRNRALLQSLRSECEGIGG